MRIGLGAALVFLLTLAACRPRLEPAPIAAAPALRWVPGPANETAPVLVVLHGLGDTPEGILRLAGALSVAHEAHAPQAPTPWREGYSWFSPGAATRDPATFCTEIQAAADRVAEDLRLLDLSRGGSRKVGLTGFSQGGILAFQLAFRHGDLFDVVAPLAGHVPVPCLPTGRPAQTTPPLLAFHGEEDPLLPVANVRDSIAALAEQGWSAHLTTYPGLEHQVSRELLDALADGLRDGWVGAKAPPAD